MADGRDTLSEKPLSNQRVVPRNQNLRAGGARSGGGRANRQPGLPALQKKAEALAKSGRRREKRQKPIQPTEPRQNRLAGAHNRHFLFEKLNILILFNSKSGFCAPARRLCRGAVGCMVFDVFIGEVRFSIALVAFSVLGAPGVARGAAAGGLAQPTGGRARRPVQMGASQGAGLG